MPAVPVADPEPSALPPELIEDLVRLLAEAIVADIRQYPNLAEPQPNPEATVESRSGLDRNESMEAGRLQPPPVGEAPAATPKPRSRGSTPASCATASVAASPLGGPKTPTQRKKGPPQARADRRPPAHSNLQSYKVVA
jgi:hypothetical protein